jgi:hypothetical protein
MKLKRVEGGYAFDCPGCEGIHVFYDFMADGSKGWWFNGDMEKPTFTPSLRNTRPGFCCHLNLTDGKFQFHTDCTHANKGKWMDMVELREPFA